MSNDETQRDTTPADLHQPDDRNRGRRAAGSDTLDHEYTELSSAGRASIPKRDADSHEHGSAGPDATGADGGGGHDDADARADVELLGATTERGEGDGEGEQSFYTNVPDGQDLARRIAERHRLQMAGADTDDGADADAYTTVPDIHSQGSL